MSIVDECRQGMEIVGERYKNKEYFLGELIMSGEIFKEAMALVEPNLKAGQNDPEKKIMLIHPRGFAYRQMILGALRTGILWYLNLLYPNSKQP